MLRPPDISIPMRLWLRAAACSHYGDGNQILVAGDGSGLRNHATAYGTGPLFIASGINGLPTMRFSGTEGLQTDATYGVTANNHTGIMVMKTTALAGGQANVFSWRSENYFMIQHASSGAPNIGLYNNGGYSWFPLGVPVILSWVSTPTGLSFRINGINIYDSSAQMLVGVGPATPLDATAINTASIFKNQFGQGNTGDLSELIIYPAALGLPELIEVESSLADIYGLELLQNFTVPKRCVFFGDSRGLPANSGQGSAESTVSSLRNALGLGWFVVPASVSGDQVSQMKDRFLSDVPPYQEDGLEKAVCVVWGGVNSLINDVSAVDIYADLQTIAARARAQGFKVILCTEPACTAYDVDQEIERAALNALILGADVPAEIDGTADIAAVFATPLTDVHPTAAEGVPIANAIGAVILTL